MDRDNKLFKKRLYNLWYLRNRKYWQKVRYGADMPVDLFMVRNEKKFNEGLDFNHE